MRRLDLRIALLAQIGGEVERQRHEVALDGPALLRLGGAAPSLDGERPGDFALFVDREHVHIDEARDFPLDESDLPFRRQGVFMRFGELERALGDGESEIAEHYAAG